MIHSNERSIIKASEGRFCQRLSWYQITHDKTKQFHTNTSYSFLLDSFAYVCAFTQIFQKIEQAQKGTIIFTTFYTRVRYNRFTLLNVNYRSITIYNILVINFNIRYSIPAKGGGEGGGGEGALEKYQKWTLFLSYLLQNPCARNFTGQGRFSKKRVQLL